LGNLSNNLPMIFCNGRKYNRPFQRLISVLREAIHCTCTHTLTHRVSVY